MTGADDASDFEALAEHLAVLARELADGDSTTSIVQMIVEAAVREVPGARYAGVTVVSQGGASTPAATGALVGRIDALQYGMKQGPCLDAAFGGDVVRADDLAAEPRWPEFAAATARLGVRSMLSFPLLTAPGDIAALNLYAEEAGSFPHDAERIGFLLAAHAAAAMVTSRQQSDLRAALDTRDLIGQAKGILMERFRVTGDEAFRMLVAVSQRENTKLHAIARTLAETGELARDRHR